MHRDLTLSLLPRGTPADLPALMAREIVSNGIDADDRPIPILQRAGFTGPEIAAHLDEANRLVDAAFARAALPDPHLGNLTRALAAALEVCPDLTRSAERTPSLQGAA